MTLRRRLFLIAAAFVLYFGNFWALSIEEYWAAQSGAPLQDAAMLRIDDVFGNWAALYAWVYAHAWAGEPLRWLYDRSFALLLGLVLLAAWRDPQRLWRILGVNIVAGALVMVLFALYPTIGPIAALNLPQHWPAEGLGDSVTALTALRGHATTIPYLGLVFFPSYHAVGLVLTLYAAARLAWWLRYPVFLWTLISLPSLPVIGGHYFIDIIVGALLAGAALAIVRVQPSSATTQAVAH